LDATLGAPSGFEIAGPDSVFYPAKTHIRWNTNLVEVSAPEVKKPVAVRYAFGNCVEASLFGQNGMPVSSFRTDF
jgi:sialate O-acetylesterase